MPYPARGQRAETNKTKQLAKAIRSTASRKKKTPTGTGTIGGGTASAT